jgi:hypothetical protein
LFTPKCPYYEITRQTGIRDTDVRARLKGSEAVVLLEFAGNRI